MDSDRESEWENFSDQLILMLKETALAEDLSSDCVDRLHLATVEIYRANMDYVAGLKAISLPRTIKPLLN